MLHPLLSLSKEVQEALDQGKAIVALESTIISHGRLHEERVGRMLLIVISFIVSMPVSQLISMILQRLWGCLTAISYVLIIKTVVQNTSMSLLLLTE